MGFPNKQIGWSQEANLLQRIVKQLDYINKTVGANVSASLMTTSTTTTI